jgi:copper(I)-binding protein
MKARMLTGLLTLLLSAAAWADAVKIDNAWVRATAPGQKVAAAFMDLTAPADMTLVAAESAASKVVELHTMRMENDVMVMRQVKEIALPKGQTVNLKPGGLHVMLIDLNGPITAGSSVGITLVVKDKSGKLSKIPVAAPAKQPGDGGAMHHHH